MGFGGPSTSNFSFGSNPSSGANASLFGQKPSGTGFGIAASTSTSGAFGSSPFGVGSNVATGISNSAGVSTGGLFSGNFNNKASGSGSGGFSFGQNTTTVPPLGSTNSNGVPLFGGVIGTGGGGVGGTVAKPTSLFGGNANSSPGLFGSGFSSSGGFGGSNGSGTSVNGSGFAGLPFGVNTVSGGGGGVSNFLTTLPSNVNGSGICDQIQVLSVIPYGNSSLYKHARCTGSSGLKTDDQCKSAATITLQKPPNGEGSSFKISTRINNFIVRKAHAALEPSKKSLFGEIVDEFDEKTSSQHKSSPRFLTLKPKGILQKTKTDAVNNDSDSGTCGSKLVDDDIVVASSENDGSNGKHYPTLVVDHSPETEPSQSQHSIVASCE